MQHPVHVSDIHTALVFLRDWRREQDAPVYDPDNIYIIGHSAGAHIAAYLFLSPPNSPPSLPPPFTFTFTIDEHLARAIRGIIGVEGIYNLDLLLDHFPSDFYRGFVQQAFGDSSQNWKNADVTSYNVPRGSDHIRWLIAHSAADDLVDQAQANEMAKGLRLRLREEGEGRVQVDHTSLVDGHYAVIDTEPLVQVVVNFVNAST